MENWIEVIEGYKVSNLGEVYSMKSGEFVREWASTRDIEKKRTWILKYFYLCLL